MTQSLSVSNAAAPVTPAKTKSAPAAKATTQAGAPVDRLSLSPPQASPLIQAHVQLNMTGSMGIAANGVVDIQHDFVERLVKMSLGNHSKTPPEVSYDAKKGSYDVSATMQVKGISIPFEAHIKPTVSDRQVAFQLSDVTLKVAGGLHPRFLTTEATTLIAKKLHDNAYAATADAQQGIVRLDTSSLLQRVGALPYGVNLDTSKTKLGVMLSPSGDVRVLLQSPQADPAPTPGHDSDLSMSVDGAALGEVLRGVLSPKYDVQKVTISDGVMKVDGQAEYEEGTKILTAIKFLGAILVAGSGGPLRDPMAPGDDVKIPLSLTIHPSGPDLTIKPSIGQALDPIMDALKGAGLDPQKEGDHLKINVNGFWKGHEGTFTSVQFGQDRMTVKAHLNLDSFYSSPQLKGQR